MTTARSIWPDTFSPDGRIGGGVIGELVRDHGTPLMIIDEHTARTRARQIRDVFAEAFAAVGTSCAVYYAGKALLTGVIAQWMRDDGLGIDVCSPGELRLALAAGTPATRIGVHGNNKSDAFLAAAVTAGAGSIVIDSLEEIDRVADLAAAAHRVQSVRVRVSVGVHADTHAFLATSHEDQKFGLPAAAIPAAVARIRAARNLRFLGLHTHIGSQIFGAAGYVEAAKRMVGLHSTLLPGGDVPELNLGGGFGIAYVDTDAPPPIEEIARAMATAVDEESRRRGIPVPRIAIEPGRWIIGPAGITVYRVGTVKDVPLGDGTTRQYVSVDGGMSDNPRYALYDAAYSAALLRHSPAPVAVSRVVGSHCETGDIIVADATLPGDTTRGDLLAVAATGAYCAPLSSNYNLVPRPPIVNIRDGVVTIQLRGESADDVLGRDPIWRAGRS